MAGFSHLVQTTDVEPLGGHGPNVEHHTLSPSSEPAPIRNQDFTTFDEFIDTVRELAA